MNFFDKFMSEPSMFIMGVALVSFILGLILGWLIWGRRASILSKELAKLRGEHDTLKKDYAELKEKLTVTEADLKALTEESDELKVRKRQLENEKGQLYADLFSTKKELETLEADMENATEESSFFVSALATELAEARGEKPKGLKKKKKKKEETKGLGDMVAGVENPVAAALPKGIKENDLKIIEGIGPKIADLLKADGINSWADLADAAVDRLQGILDAAGPRYRIHDPGTWAQQAALARDGKWDELYKLQDDLQGGKAE
ncbi:MAG: helix-hairpin-helix domain-containing protein [Bacteroidota bacterium]